MLKKCDSRTQTVLKILLCNRPTSRDFMTKFQTTCPASASANSMQQNNTQIFSVPPAAWLTRFTRCVATSEYGRTVTDKFSVLRWARTSSDNFRLSTNNLQTRLQTSQNRRHCEKYHDHEIT